MPMSSGGHIESSSDCATRPKAREIGLTGYAVPIQPSLHIGRYVMAPAEHREPCDSRGSRTVLGAPGGEIPSDDSTSPAEEPYGHRDRSTPISGPTRRTKRALSEIKNFDKKRAPMISRAYTRHKLWSKLTPKNGSQAMPV